MIVFLSVFVTLACDVKHNDDSICKIASPLFCFLVASQASGILNYIHSITSEQQRFPDVAFNDRCQEYRS
jgi:hypothetical protein